MRHGERKKTGVNECKGRKCKRGGGVVRVRVKSIPKTLFISIRNKHTAHLKPRPVMSTSSIIDSACIVAR